MAIPESIRKFVEIHGIGFTSIHHRLAYTAQEEAAATHVPGREWAKTVVCIADGRPVLALLPANDRVDLGALRSAAGAREVRLAEEKEFSALYPECETGAMAPFGPLYGQTVFVDEALAKDLQITFHAGTHVDAIRMMYADFAKLVHPISARIGRRSIMH
jgi:Ala-tRNA(Pro) deacylase